MLSQKAYAAENHVSPSTVKRWYDKGYLPGAKRNDCTGVYEIPKDTPVPFQGKGLNKVSGKTTLMIKLLEAADSSQSVFASMFPKISERDFQDILNGLVAGQKLVLVKTEYSSYLRITDSGAILKGELDGMTAKGRKDLNTFLITISGAAFAPLFQKAINYISEHPDWAQQLLQWISPK